ncbi:exportin-2-like [Apium graveolens]|uniref:exportin-2-like n=1 Tax=Apium graveolens TaxID=4045 RepID=UPI003D7BF212
MRVLSVADISHEVASPCIKGLTLDLNRVCENPKNPVYNHYLFEAVAVLVKRAFFPSKRPHELNREGRLNQVLEIFEKLVTAPRSNEQGFYVLNTIIENLGYDVITPYMGRIWTCLFPRLQNNETAKFAKSFVIFMSLFLVKTRVEEELEVPDFGETVGYNATFVHLHNAGKKEEDVSRDIKDPKMYLVDILANISAQTPGRYHITS